MRSTMVVELCFYVRPWKPRYWQCMAPFLGCFWVPFEIYSRGFRWLIGPCDLGSCFRLLVFLFSRKGMYARAYRAREASSLWRLDSGQAHE